MSSSPPRRRDCGCCPATIDLAGAEIELVSMVARENRLLRALKDLPGRASVRLRVPRLPPVARAAHAECARGRERDPDPHPVRVLRAGRRLPADADDQPGQGRAQRLAAAQHRAADHVRRPHPAGRPGGRRGPDPFRRRDAAHGHPALGTDLRGAQLRPDRPHLPPRLGRRRRPTSKRPRRLPSRGIRGAA